MVGLLDRKSAILIQVLEHARLGLSSVDGRRFHLDAQRVIEHTRGGQKFQVLLQDFVEAVEV